MSMFWNEAAQNKSFGKSFSEFVTTSWPADECVTETRYHPGNTVPTMKHDSGNIMLWNSFSSAGTGNIAFQLQNWKPI